VLRTGDVLRALCADESACGVLRASREGTATVRPGAHRTSIRTRDDVKGEPAEATSERYEAAKCRRDAALEGIRHRLALLRPDARVFLVDDNRALLGLLARRIERGAGVTTVAEDDAEKALALARAATPGFYAVAILDLSLGHPTISGLTIAEALPRDVGIILITGVGHEIIEECGARVSAIHLLVKPPTDEELDRICADIRRRVGKEPFAERQSSLPPPV